MTEWRIKPWKFQVARGSKTIHFFNDVETKTGYNRFWRKTYCDKLKTVNHSSFGMDDKFCVRCRAKVNELTGKNITLMDVLEFTRQEGWWRNPGLILSVAESQERTSNNAATENH